MEVTKEFIQGLVVPYELALALKEKDFDEQCGFIYALDIKPTLWDYKNSIFEQLTNTSEICTAPLYQQVIDWLEESHNIIVARYIEEGDRKSGFCFIIDNEIGQQWEYGENKTETMNKAINEALKLI